MRDSKLSLNLEFRISNLEFIGEVQQSRISNLEFRINYGPLPFAVVRYHRAGADIFLDRLHSLLF